MGGQSLDVKKLASPDDLRAVSSPQRLQVIDALYSMGQATVSRLAHATGLAIGSVSFHLRTLAEVDIARIVDHPSSADRRQTWWEPVHKDGFDWDPDIYETDWGAAGMRARWAASQSVDWASRRADPASLPPSWSRTVFRNDMALRLTPEDVRALSEALLALVLQFRDEGDRQMAADNTTDRRPYIVQLEGYPYQAPKTPVDGGSAATEA